MTPLLTTSEVTARLGIGVSQEKVQRLIRAGVLRINREAARLALA